MIETQVESLNISQFANLFRKFGDVFVRKVEILAVGIFIFATMICIIVKQIMNKKAEAKELEE